MQTATLRIRLFLAVLSALPLTPIMAGCGGGNSNQIPNPQTYVGSYVGTFTATYDPRSPLSGTVSGALNFVVASDGTVTVTSPVQSPTGSDGGGTGTITGSQISASGSNTAFGLRSLLGQLQVASGKVSGSGTITVVSQSELAYGTWQAQKQ